MKATIQAFAGLAQALFALILTVFTAVQICVARQQTSIQRETREIAYAALNRPYILIEFVSHNFDEWRSTDPSERRVDFAFTFRFCNYGNSPAIIAAVTTYAFLSVGRHQHRKSKHTAVDFPDPAAFIALLVAKSSTSAFHRRLSKYTATIPGKVTSDLRSGIVVLRPGEISETVQEAVFNSVAVPREDGRASTLGMAPWLIGQVKYRDMLGRSHNTNFCFRGSSDGTTLESYGPPYNERT